MQLDKKTLFHLSIFTLFGFSLIAYLILAFTNEAYFWEIVEPNNLLRQISIGLGLGLLVSVLALAILKLNAFKGMNTFFADFIKKLNPQWYHILFYSFCAGVGEELLFRGAIQHFIFIWPTALLFVLIHGYINPKNIKMSIYGVFLVFVSAGFGYLMKIEGIYAAMAAHFIYDVVMFGYLKYYDKR